MSVTVNGVLQTKQALGLLPRRVQKRILPKVARAGGGPYLKSARKNAPRRNRLFARTLVLVVRRYPTGAAAVIGQEKVKSLADLKRFDKARSRLQHSGGISGRGEAAPIHLIEESTRPHSIVPRSARLLRFTVGGQGVVARQVLHPGTRGQGVLARAARESHKAAQIAAETKARDEVNKGLTVV